MPEIPQFISDFSKEFSQDERNTSADQIKKTRSEYFLNLIRENGRKQRIEELGQEISKDEIEITSIINETKEIEQELEEKRSRVFGKLLEKLGDASLSEMLDIKDYDRDAKERDLAILKEELRQLVNTEVDLDGLKNAKKMLNNFYAGQTEKWKEFDQESSAREVDVAMEKHDCLFVHAIGYKKIIPGNSPLAGGVDLQTQLEIVLALKPDISVSSIKKGDSSDNIAWHNLGVILRGGKILSASAVDAGTVATSLRKERLGSEEEGWARLKPVEDKIESAIVDRSEHSINEFVIRKPEIAGFYLLEDRYGVFGERGIKENGVVYAKEIMPFLEKYGLPLYAIENGQAVKIKIDTTSRDNTIEREKVFTSEDILKDDFIHLTEEQREEMLDDLVEKQPFLSSAFGPEGHFFDNIGSGKEAYQNCVMQGNKLPVNCQIEKKPFSQAMISFLEKNWIHLKEEANTVAIVSEINTVDVKNIFIRVDKQNYVVRCGERRSLQANPCPSTYGILPDEVLSVYIGGRSRNERPRNPDDYFDAVSRVLTESTEDLKLSYEEKLKNKYGEKEWFYYNYPIEQYKIDKKALAIEIPCIAYNLYGYGEEALRFDDAETASKAFQMASQILPLEEYNAFKTKRTAEDGRFKIYKEDLYLKKKPEENSQNRDQSDYLPQKP